MPELTSRGRMLAALDRQPVDHIPCCFMSFTALRRRCHEDLVALAEAELAQGFDSLLFIPGAGRPARPEHPDLRGLPVRFHPDVKVVEWQEPAAGAAAILHKRYVTPAGDLTTAVRVSDDWPHGSHIPFIDDYQVPRAIKPLITRPADLAALAYLLQPPSAEDATRFAAEAEMARQFAARHSVLLAGGWGVGVDLACWLCGVQPFMTLQADQPQMLGELLGLIHAWNLQRMALVLSAPVDLYIRRAWYEGCDFVTPRFFRREILPRLQAEAGLAHAHGARFGYICSSGLEPLLDLYLEAGIDVLIGVDPVQGTRSDLHRLKAKLGDRVCLWGGVSGAITVELGSEDEVRAAVRRAIAELGPHGFILSPVDNITVDAEQTWRNIAIFKDEWHKQWGV